jgi:hypothetical protein
LCAAFFRVRQHEMKFTIDEADLNVEANRSERHCQAQARRRAAAVLPGQADKAPD